MRERGAHRTSAVTGGVVPGCLGCARAFRGGLPPGYYGPWYAGSQRGKRSADRGVGGDGEQGMPQGEDGAQADGIGGCDTITSPSAWLGLHRGQPTQGLQPSHNHDVNPVRS